LKEGPNGIITTGIITALWDHLYIQADYNFDGSHYVEKFLILENKEENTTQLHILSGSYANDFDAQSIVWENWLAKVKELSTM